MNSSDLSFLSDKERFDSLVREYIISRTQLRTAKSRREYRFHVGNFRRWWIGQGASDLSHAYLLAWMLDGLNQAAVKTVTVKVIALDHFFEFLVERGTLSANPLKKMRQGFRARGYRGIVRELQQTGSVEDVLGLAEHPFSGPLGASCLAYLDFLSSLGRRCANHRYDLIAFERFLRRSNLNAWPQVRRPHVEQWVRERKPASDYRRRCWLLVVEDLFRFLVNRGEVGTSPVPPPGPHRRRSLQPRIFSRNEIQSILEEADKQPDHRLMPFRGQTYRMYFLTLYTLGLRGGEAINLRLGDLDFVQHSLTIGQTKFYKGRVLPIGPRFESALRRYMDEHPLLRGCGRNAFLFPTDSHRTSHLAKDSAFRMLRKIVGRLGITTPPETRPPCLHSFRHSFAVHWMEQWLREGADVQTKLPLLSAFLGHVDAAATQVYLTMTPSRLELIGKRFENSVRKEPMQ